NPHLGGLDRAGGQQRRHAAHGAAAQDRRALSSRPLRLQRIPNVVFPNTALLPAGNDRQYCGGASTCPSGSAAACQAQRGLYSTARPRATRSAWPSATIACAWRGSVIRPTATVGTPTSRLTAWARCT